MNDTERDRSVNFPPMDLQKSCLQYVCWYASIDDLTSNEDIDSIYKGLTIGIRRIVPKGTIKLYSKTKLNEEGEIEWDFSKDRVYCSQWKGCSQIVALLRHLRNSIAHDGLIMRRVKLEIIDRDVYQHNLITAKGYFQKDTIKKILGICINSINQKTR